LTLRATINGIEVMPFRDSVKVSEKLDGRSSGSLILRYDAEDIPIRAQRGQEVIVWDDEVTETVNRTVASRPGTMGVSGRANGGIDVGISPDRPSGTIEIMHCPLESLDYTDLIRVGPDADNHFLSVYADSGTVNFYATGFNEGTGSTEDFFISTDACLTVDVPSRISVVWAPDGAGTRFWLYVDGALKGTEALACPAAIVNLLEYKSPYVTFYYTARFLNIAPYHCYVADVRWWTTERSAAQVLAARNVRVDGDPDLLAYWKLDEGDGYLAADSIGELDIPLDGDYPFWDYCPVDWAHEATGPACQPVAGDYRYYGGKVKGVAVDRTAPGIVEQKISLTDFGEVLDRTIIDYESLTPVLTKPLVQLLAYTHLTAEGITYQCIPSDGPSIAEVSYRKIFLQKAFKSIATDSGWLLYIDQYKEVRCHPRSYRAALWHISNDDSPSRFLEGSMSVQEDRAQYANRIYARFQYLDGDGVTKLTGMIMAQDAEEIAARAAAEGGSGLYEATVDLADVDSPDQAAERTQGILAQRKVMGSIVSYRTALYGLRAGQLQSIEDTDLGISGAYLITEVSLEFDNLLPTWTVTASSWHVSKEPMAAIENAIESKRNFDRVSEDFTSDMVSEASAAAIAETVTIESGPVEHRIGTMRIGFSEVG
jgi:hypothetical protein